MNLCIHLTKGIRFAWQQDISVTMTMSVKIKVNTLTSNKKKEMCQGTFTHTFKYINKNRVNGIAVTLIKENGHYIKKKKPQKH